MKTVEEVISLRAKAFLEYSVEQRASYVDEDLTEDEREFLWFVQVGDVEALVELLRINRELDVDCCDFRGQRALDIAVSSRNLLVLDFLLRKVKVSPVHFYSAILRAVFEKDIHILEILLDRAEEDAKLQNCLADVMNASPECLKCLPEVAATNLTPTMAAAMNGDLEITRLLLEKGYCIQKPHSPKCRCQSHCINKHDGYETLTQSITRINAFKALASPTYLILTSEDPILSAFQLSRELDDLSSELPEHQKEYSALAKQCSTFAADLLNECRNTEEVQTVLVQKKGFNDPRPHRFSRLHLAVRYEQKEFVTHPSCQQVLRSMWVEGLGGWYGWRYQRRALHVVKHILLSPVVALGFIFIPKAEVIGPLKVPLNRFIYSVTSYLFFLSLLMVTLLNDRRYDTQSPVTWTESTVCIFVMGHSWAIITSLFWMGFGNYFRSWWSVFDLIMFSLFLATEILWISAFMYSLIAGNGEDSSNRMTWAWYHPVLLGEGMYATASVMAFSRLLLWCHISSKLGPLGTSIKYMLGDVTKFFVLFFIIMFAFATGINSIYKNYKNSLTIKENNQEEEQSDAFVTLKNTFKSLFWAIFGMGEPDFAQIILTANHSGETMSDDQVDDQSEHVFTEGVGYGLWGLYHMVTVIVLLNMLIAMMAESYQRVQLNADLEWKFACSGLWLTVFDNHSIVPVPFNLIPSMHRLALMCRWAFARKPDADKQAGKLNWSKARCCYWDPEIDPAIRKEDEEKYEKLTVQLIRRYLQCKDIRESRALTSSFSVAELKQKLKSEILQDLQQSPSIPCRSITRRRTKKDKSRFNFKRINPFS